MPFADYKDFEDCVQQQITEGHNEEEARKICGAIQAKTEEPPKEESAPTQITRQLEGRPISREPRIEEGHDYALIRDTVMLSPGWWKDGATRQLVNYTPEMIERASTKWISNRLNMNHSRSVLDTLGEVDISSIHIGDTGEMRGDVIVHPLTTHAKDALMLIESGLVNGLSVEVATVDENREDGIYATDGEFYGLALVTIPACNVCGIYGELMSENKRKLQETTEPPADAGFGDYADMDDCIRQHVEQGASPEEANQICLDLQEKAKSPETTADVETLSAKLEKIRSCNKVKDKAIATQKAMIEENTRTIAELTQKIDELTARLNAPAGAEAKLSLAEAEPAPVPGCGARRRRDGSWGY